MIAIFTGLFAGAAPGWSVALVALGLVVGFLNISETEVERFLIASIALLVIGAASINALFASGAYAAQTQAMLGNFVSFVSAAALVVALKTVITLGSHHDDKKK